MDRLVEEPGGKEANMDVPLQHYHRHRDDLLRCYTSILKTFNADQPIDDLFDQGTTMYWQVQVS